MSLFQFSHHNNGLCVLFPAQPPEVNKSRFGGSLSSNISFLLTVTIDEIRVDVVAAKLTVVVQFHSRMVVWKGWENN